MDFAQARYFNSDFGRFSTPDPLQSSANSILPQSWNRYVYVINNPLKLVDPSGQVPEVTVEGNEKDDYLIRLQREMPSVVLEIDSKTSKVKVVGFREEDTLKAITSMSASEFELYNAITNTEINATINTVRKDGNVDFGRYDQPGKNTIDMADLEIIDQSSDVGFTSSQVVAHETLEAYGSATRGVGDTTKAKSHNYANQYYPGLEAVAKPPLDFYNKELQIIYFVNDQKNSASNVTVRITYQPVNPIPTAPDANGNRQPTRPRFPAHIIKLTKGK